MNHDTPVHDHDMDIDTSPNPRFAKLTDGQITTLLEEYRTRDDAAGEFDSIIVDLELEAVRRNVAVPAVYERMPPGLALERCRYWIREGHVDGAARCMWDLSILGAWRLFVEIRAIEVTEARLFLLQALLLFIDTVRYGKEAAGERAHQLARCGFDHDEDDLYLQSTLASHFADWMRTPRLY
jgi:hypothetical protein